MLRVLDGDDIEWEGSLADFERANEDDPESCEQARALGVGESRAMGMGFVVKRLAVDS